MGSESEIRACEEPGVNLGRPSLLAAVLLCRLARKIPRQVRDQVGRIQRSGANADLQRRGGVVKSQSARLFAVGDVETTF